MARDDRRRRAARLLPRAIDGVGGGEHDRLRVGGEVEFFCRTFGDQLADVLIERVGGFLQRFAHDGAIGEGVEHANGLRTLTRKNECEFHEILKIRSKRRGDALGWTATDRTRGACGWVRERESPLAKVRSG